MCIWNWLCTFLFFCRFYPCVGTRNIWLPITELVNMKASAASWMWWFVRIGRTPSCLLTTGTCTWTCDAGNSWVKTRRGICSLRCCVLCRTVTSAGSFWEIWSSVDLSLRMNSGETEAQTAARSRSHPPPPIAAVTAAPVKSPFLLAEPKWPWWGWTTASSCWVTRTTTPWRTGTAAPPTSAPSCSSVGGARTRAALQTSGAWVCLSTPCSWDDTRSRIRSPQLCLPKSARELSACRRGFPQRPNAWSAACWGNPLLSDWRPQNCLCTRGLPVLLRHSTACTKRNALHNKHSGSSKRTTRWSPRGQKKHSENAAHTLVFWS